MFLSEQEEQRATLIGGAVEKWQQQIVCDGRRIPIYVAAFLSGLSTVSGSEVRRAYNKLTTQ